MITPDTVFLVVDDADTMRKVNASQLRSLGARQVLMAANGVEALNILRKQRVDVIISDWNMPLMDGLELLQKVRATEHLAHLPFIIVTAESDRELVAQAIAAGVGSILIKPYTAQELGQRIGRAMRHKPRLTAIAAPVADTATSVEERSPLAASPPVAVRPTLLVVDDVPDNLTLIAGLFKDDYRVRIANNGERALAICASDNPPDLLLLDVMMPHMDGFEVARRLRENPETSAIPVIFITALTDVDARRKGLELGAVDFVHKPIEPELLHLRVRNFLRYVELHKHLQADYDDMLELSRLREDVEHMTRHDLKGPLAGIIGLVQGLTGAADLLPRQLELLQLVEANSLQLLDMINLSAELYKIEMGRFELNAQLVDIGEILQRLVSTVRSTFAVKELTVMLDLGESVGTRIPSAWADTMLCYSLLHNLLKNACEAAPAGSRVSVCLTDGEPLLQITLENHPAVPAPMRERFFDKFATFGKHGGSGLGTYSAKLLSEAQHGQLQLQVDESADLTRLVLSLPRAQQPVSG